MIKSHVFIACLQVIRQPQRSFVSLLFYVLVALAFPLLLPPESIQLPMLFSAVVWMTLSLTCLYAHPLFFHEDHRCGVLDQVYMAGNGFLRYAVVRVLQFWLSQVLPLILITPLLGLAYGVSPPVFALVMLSLLLGTPVLVLLCALLSALMLGLRQSLLLCFLVLPCLVPILIFGGGTARAYLDHASVMEPLQFLLGMLLLGLSLLPQGVASALKFGIGSAPSSC